MLNDLRYRFRAVFGREKMEAELDEELRFHMQCEAEKYRRAGMSEQEALRRVRMAFGGVEQVKEDVRETRGTSLLEQTWQDVRFAVRLLGKNPGFTIVAALTLALGIGASTAVFSLVDTILLHPLPYPDTSRAVMVWGEAPVGSYYGNIDLPFDPRQFQVLAPMQRSFADLGAFRKKSFNLTGSNEPELQEGVEVSAGFFPALGERPLLGRSITALDDQAAHENVVVLSEWLWRSRYHGDHDIIGKSVVINGSPSTVIGVMPSDFVFPDGAGMPAGLDVPRRTALWVPLALPRGARGSNDLGLVGELRPGVSMAQLNDELKAYATRFSENNPAAKGYWARAVPLAKQAVSDTQRPLLLWMGAVGVLLLIACSNVAGLMLNRAVARRREFTLRGALGAQRSRLVRQVTSESVVLASVGGALGIGLAEISLFSVKRFGPATLPNLAHASLNLEVALFAILITLSTGLVFGLVPALAATRMSLVEALKEGGQRTLGGVTAPRVRNTLLVFQVALAVVLVTGAGLLVRTFHEMVHTQAGFETTHVLTFELPLPTSPRYADTNTMAQVYGQVLERVRAIPGVLGAGFASDVPMGGETDSTVIRLAGRTNSPGDAPGANYQFASPGFFDAMRTPLEQGRDFTEGDILSAQPVTIINRTMAGQYWHGKNAIGQQVGVGLTRIPLRTVIGVVADTKQTSLRESPSPEMYVPYTQNEIKIWPSMQAMQYAVRLRGGTAGFAAQIRQAVDAVDPDLPVAQLTEMQTLVDSSMTGDRFAMLLLSGFGLLALALAAVGMYGVLSYTVLQRRGEIGMRMALGAARGEILTMVLRQGGALTLTGITLGLVVAAMTTKLMEKFLYGVRPLDPGTFATVALLLMLVALAACAVPALRATQVDPMIALRME